MLAPCWKMRCLLHRQRADRGDCTRCASRAEARHARGFVRLPHARIRLAVSAAGDRRNTAPERDCWRVSGASPQPRPGTRRRRATEWLSIRQRVHARCDGGLRPRDARNRNRPSDSGRFRARTDARCGYPRRALLPAARRRARYRYVGNHGSAHRAARLEHQPAARRP